MPGLRFQQVQLVPCYRCKHLSWMRGKYYCMWGEPIYMSTHDDHLQEDPTRVAWADCYVLASTSEYMKKWFP